ncbi:MAG: hypothetical protein AB1641_29390 [Thermodesulfobacteriota bacterium]
MKHLLVSVMIVALALGTGLASAWAADEDTGQVVKENEKLGAKHRIVFLKEVKGNKMVFIRLTPDQVLRTKVQGKTGPEKGMSRLVLHPRQIAALNDILKAEGLEKRPTKLAIRIPEATLNQKGLKSLYLVRPLSFFASGVPEEIEEPSPVTTQ